MPSSSPTFSICIPYYNAKDYLDECLKSVEIQTFKDWEVIIVDDGSDSCSIEYLRARTRGYSKIKVLYHHNNMGLYAARTDAIAASTGSYLLFLDSDDAYVGPYVLDNLYEHLQKWDPDILLFNMTGNLSTLQPSIDYSALGFCQDGPLSIQQIEEVIIGDYALNNIWNKVFKRTVFDSEKPIQQRLNMCEDRYRFAEVLFRASSVALYNKVLYYYRINNTSLSRQSFCNHSFEEQMFTEHFIRTLALQHDINLDRHRTRILKVAAADLRASSVSAQNFPSHFQELVDLVSNQDLVIDAYSNIGRLSLRPDEKILVAATMHRWPKPIICFLATVAQLIKLTIQP